MHIGENCDFDFSNNPVREKDALFFLQYADTKLPAVFNALSVEPYRVTLRFGDRGGGAFIQPSTIELGLEHPTNDCGCIIHESVHAAQHQSANNGRSGLSLYSTQTHAFEGIADYYRITLSNDRSGDYFNDDKRNLVQNFRTDELYNCASEFIAHLRIRSGQDSFVVKLNNALRSGDVMQFVNLFATTFSLSYDQLLREYELNRNEIVGGEPGHVNRFEYFTRTV